MSRTFLIFLISLLSVYTFGHEGTHENSFDEMGLEGMSWQPRGCQAATLSQIAIVDLGNSKADDFYKQCLASTQNSRWCSQVLRPNPDSLTTFNCTYGNKQPHQLVNPDETSWQYPIQAVQLVEELESLGIKTCLIYNWWRPEPYNTNVGGAAGRHPFATSVDVRFCSPGDMEAAFSRLCEWRAQGKLRAIGYYGTNSLHIGVGDRTANTWGKSCPKQIAQLN